MISILLFYFDLELKFHLKNNKKKNNLIRYVISWTLFSNLKNIFIYKSKKIGFTYMRKQNRQPVRLKSIGTHGSGELLGLR